MANEQALKDDNSSYGLLVHNNAGTETRKLKQGANGGLPVEMVGDSEESLVGRFIDVDETEDEVAAADTFLTGYWISNRANAERVVRLYQGPASAVTVGTTAPKLTIPLAAGQSANLSKLRIKFTGGMCIAATTGIADNDTGAPGNNEIVANIFYRTT